jgi:hypothetical protein
MKRIALCTRALMVAALLGGCGGSNTARGYSGGGTGGSYDEDAGSFTGGSGGSGVGGGSSGSGGSGGGFESDASASADSGGAAGSGGGAGGGTFPDASVDGVVGFPQDGATVDVPPGPPRPDALPEPDCEISFEPINPQRFDRLPAGATSKLRVEGKVGGKSPPRTPQWTWTVRYENAAPFTPKMQEMDPAVVEFPLTGAGSYTITASVAANCRNSVTATAVDDPIAQFWLRVTPPPNMDLPPIENESVDVEAGRSLNHDLAFRLGVPLEINPQDQSATHEVFSYVRITSDMSTVRLEGHTANGAYDVHLDGSFSYDVLVIPDDVIAPQLFHGTPSALGQRMFKMDDGVPITGQVRGPMGPIKGARVLLRADQVPSTIGLTTATGDYQMRARAGDFAALIIPPANSGLPQARLTAGSGLKIYDQTARATLDFEWSAVTTTSLDLTVHRADGSVPAGVHVRLESAAGFATKVGTLTVDKLYPLDASAFVQLDATVDARGAASFADLPHGMYTLTLTPLDGSAAITTTQIDLTSAMARVARTVSLAAKIALTGKLLPPKLTAGATLLALDPDADPAAPTPTAILDPSGAYLLKVDPGRSYALVLEGAPGQRLPRTLLRSIVAPMKDSVREDLTVPDGLTISGVVKNAGGTPVPGALIQAYCVGRPPSCIDPAARDTTTVQPTSQAISDGTGAYQVLVPDPQIAN